MAVVSVALWVATALLAVAVVLGVIRVATATEPATRAVVGDLIFFSVLGMLAIQGFMHRSSVTVDLLLIASILAILSTVSLARILTRGRR